MAACKAAFTSRYRANVAACKAAFASRYRANTAACRAAFASRYMANAAACKVASRAKYRAYTASYKAAFRSRYGANRDVYKVAFRTRYEVNEAACKAASKATYQAKREQVRSAYPLNSAQNRVACAKRYACMGTKIRAQRRGRYVLREPNDDVKLRYVTERKCKLIANSKVRSSLKWVFAATHADVALNMSQTGLTIVACRLASQSVLAKALKERKHSAGKLLGAIAKINELSITCDELGDQGHCASSEPYFYETAYAPVNPLASESAIWRSYEKLMSKTKFEKKCCLTGLEPITAHMVAQLLGHLAMQSDQGSYALYMI